MAGPVLTPDQRDPWSLRHLLAQRAGPPRPSPGRTDLIGRSDTFAMSEIPAARVRDDEAPQATLAPRSIHAHVPRTGPAHRRRGSRAGVAPRRAHSTRTAASEPRRRPVGPPAALGAAGGLSLVSAPARSALGAVSSRELARAASASQLRIPAGSPPAHPGPAAPRSAAALARLRGGRQLGARSAQMGCCLRRCVGIGPERRRSTDPAPRWRVRQQGRRARVRGDGARSVAGRGPGTPPPPPSAGSELSARRTDFRPANSRPVTLRVCIHFPAPRLSKSEAPQPNSACADGRASGVQWWGCSVGGTGKS